MTHLIVGLVAVDARNCLINPRIHGIGCFSHESLRVTVLLEALNGFFEAFNRLLVVGFPRVQIAVEQAACMKTLSRSYIGDDTMI